MADTLNVALRISDQRTTSIFLSVFRYPVHALDLNAICSSPAPPEEIITTAKREAKRNAPAILYIPSITRSDHREGHWVLCVI